MQSKPVFRLIIAGSRYFSDYQLLEKWANHMLSQKVLTHRIIIVSGTAKGADTLGELYATRYGYDIQRHFPDWQGLGKKAGPVRNRQMANNADALLAFATPTSRGTKSMIGIAKELNLPFKHVVISSANEDRSYWQRVKVKR